MEIPSFSFLFFLLFARECVSYTFEDYKDAISSVGDDCSAAFSSLDVITKFKFFDASARIPVGILQGHFNTLGAYDECINIDIPEKKILGKYCTASISTSSLLNHLNESRSPVNKNLTANFNAAENVAQTLQHVTPLRGSKKSVLLPFSLGICLPKQCSNNSAFLKLLHLQFDETLCITKESYSEMTTKARISWYVILAFFIVAVISTIYDVVIDYNGKEPYHDVLVAFSFYTNGKKLCQTSRNPSQLLCLNGLKTLSIIWVIAGHTYGSIVEASIDNYLDLIPWIQSYSSMIILGATVSVDSFFTIGGILSVYTLLRSQDPGLKSNIRNIPLLYLHRYLRLTPAFAIIIYISWSGLVPYFADGPMWHIVKTNGVPCERSWWAALLYIQNYRSEECVGQSWYLSVDMQLFILSPLIWIPLRKWPELTLKVMYGLVLLGIVIPFGIAFYYELPATIIGSPSHGFMDVYYMKTHARFATYVIGMIAGYFIYHAKQKKKIVINPVALFWLWMITLIVLYGVVYIGYPLVIKEAPTLQGFPTDVDEATRWWNSIYIALSRPAWSSALALLIYLCVTGYGGPVNWFLSASPMQFLAKLSYCMYLNHVIFILIRMGQTRDTLHFGDWEMINMLISIIMVIIPASIVQSLLFESPMIRIEKIIFGKNNTKKHDLSSSTNEV
ncbi:nose resistant to fluoxetine protein 6-like [Coccinella septempunctata]|uniref:nose resistant to fluoxetine protein 6-like n=1 Tax=Coccinella septempunctata TaxID=41139 RepID=UPI001D06B20D|nr:nose resistant to fluoxetine protein 6-like [Coccinella septempunctata]